MATASLRTTGRPEPAENHDIMEKRYVIKSSVDFFPLDSSSVTPKYVLKTADGRSYVISERLRNILLMFDGKRSLHQVAEAISAQEKKPVTGEQMKQIFAVYIGKYGLVDEADKSAAEPPAAPPAKKSSFDFTFRLPFLPARLVTPITSRLTWLYRPPVAIAALACIAVAHVAFYQNWFIARTPISFGSSDFLAFYIVGLSTALFHELGHASACRAYKCEHGAIGFLVYLIFPAFYVNLSNAWRLPGKQRAVIDAGGMYFQLMTVIPLLLLFVLTGKSYFCAGIYAVNWMVLFSLNPLLKFDGYWLLVDLTGLVNLQKRGWRVVKEIILWSLGIGKGIPALGEVRGISRKLLLVMYSFITLTFFVSLILLLLTFAPAQVKSLIGNLHAVTGEASHGVRATLSVLGKVLMNVFFFLFIYRLLKSTVFRLFRKENWRKS